MTWGGLYLSLVKNIIKLQLTNDGIWLASIPNMCTNIRREKSKVVQKYQQKSKYYLNLGEISCSFPYESNFYLVRVITIPTSEANFTHENPCLMC